MQTNSQAKDDWTVDDAKAILFISEGQWYPKLAISASSFLAFA